MTPPSRPFTLRGLPGRHPVALTLAALVLAAQAARLPTLGDPTGAALPDGWHLHTPWSHVLLAPITTLWDGIAMLSMPRLQGLLVGLAIGYLAWRIRARRARPQRWGAALGREAWTLGVVLIGFVLFVLVGVTWTTRAPARLAGLTLDDLAFEPHAHTNASHDVQGWPVAGLDAEASRAWHQRAGIDAVFLTDHNTVAGWSQRRGDPAPGEAIICPGVELSAHSAHVVVLGSPLPADQRPYRGTPANRAALFQEVRATPGAVAIASLPEYRGQAAEFAAEGVQGFEIVSGSPKANAFTRAERDSVIALARQHGLALVGAGDQHGYGATPMVWNVMTLPGWRRAGTAPCAAIVARLRSGGPDAARIVERTRLRTDATWPVVLTPLGVAWIAWATMPPASAAIWLLWIVAVAWVRRALRHALRRRGQQAIISTVSPYR